MANAKQYSDLEQAQTVNNTDQFAVAQEGADELKTVTTEQVAERVAGIVSTDQLQEFISDTALGKQVLAQALVNKGVDTSATDTLAQMAAKIDPLDVVGAQEYLSAKWQFLTSQGLISSPDTVGYTVALNYKDLILTVNCTTKTITTRRIVGAETGWTTLDTVTDADILSQCAMMTPNKDHSSIAIVTYTSGTVNLMVYDIGDDGSLTKAGGTINTPYTSWGSHYTYLSLFLSPDGRTVYFQCASSSTYTMYKFEVETGTQSTVTLNGGYLSNCAYCTMLDENTIAVISSGERAIVLGNISGDQIIVAELNQLYGDQGEYNILPLPKDNRIVLWNAKSYTNYGGEVRILQLVEWSTGNVISSQETAHVRLENKTSSTGPSVYTYGGFMCFRLEDGVYTIYNAYTGKAKYTVSTDKLELDSGTTATIGGRPMSSIFVINQGNLNGGTGDPESTYATEDGRIFTAYRGTINTKTPVVWSSGPLECTFYQDTPVVGLAYRKNGQEVLFKVPYFNETEYAAGAYALKSTEAVLDITGEGE